MAIPRAVAARADWEVNGLLYASIVVALATIVLVGITAYYAKVTALLLREAAIGRLTTVVPVLIDSVSEPDTNIAGAIDNVGGKKAIDIQISLEGRKWQGGTLFSTHGFLAKPEVLVNAPVAFKSEIPAGMNEDTWADCLRDMKRSGLLRVAVNYSDVFGRKSGIESHYYRSGEGWTSHGRKFSGMVEIVQDIDVLLPEWLRQGGQVSLLRRLYVAVLPRRLRMSIRGVRKKLWPDHFPEDSWR